MSDEMKVLSEAVAAFVPADSKGVLIVKLRGNYVTYEMVDAMNRYLKHQIDQGNLKCGFLCVVENDDLEVSLQMVTDDQLRDVGFERIQEPKPDLTDITRSFGLT